MLERMDTCGIIKNALFRVQKLECLFSGNDAKNDGNFRIKGDDSWMSVRCNRMFRYTEQVETNTYDELDPNTRVNLIRKAVIKWVTV
jgi:hypothetical protein